MGERAYTVSEIDAMRERVRALVRRELGPTILPGTPYSQSDAFVARALAQADRERVVEERLRTYMAAGVDPDELR